MTMATVRRPALRYHGGKWQLAPWIVRHFPPHDAYTEGFCGAASVLARKARSRTEVLNDLDGDVVNVFRVLRDAAARSQLAEALALTPFAREEFRAAYEPTEDPVERARRTLIRSHLGFGSDSVNANRGTGFRANNRLSGTTPAMDWARLPAAFEAWTERLRGVTIEQRPAVEVLAEFDGPGTLHYVDPPYPHSTRSDVRGYSHEMSDSDHRDLAAVLRGLDGSVVLSGYDCPLYDELFGDWRRLDRPVTVFRASRRVESLWFNRRAEASLQPTLFD